MLCHDFFHYRPTPNDKPHEKHCQSQRTTADAIWGRFNESSPSESPSIVYPNYPIQIPIRCPHMCANYYPSHTHTHSHTQIHVWVLIYIFDLFYLFKPCLVSLWVCRRLGHRNAKWQSNKAGKNIAAHNFHALIRIFSAFFRYSVFRFCGFIADFVLYVSVLCPPLAAEPLA